jgi:putative oxidoreductase
MKHVKVVLIWIIGLMFIVTGVLKLIQMDTMSVVLFKKADYSTWLLYVVGLFELAGGMLLLIKKTRPFGAAMIAVVMLGAIWTHIVLKDNMGHIIVPLLIILFAGYLVMNKEK